MAAGIGDALAGADQFALSRREFRQAVDPARQRPVGGARVDDAGHRIGDQRDGLAGRRIRQAQERHVGRIEQPRTLRRILALVRVDAQQLDVRAATEELVDLQAGRTFLAIHENFVCHLRPT